MKCDVMVLGLFDRLDNLAKEFRNRLDCNKIGLVKEDLYGC